MEPRPLGAEFRNVIPIPDAPLGLVFTGASQTLIGDENAYGLQAGLSGGYPFFADGVVVTPYLHPRRAGARTFPPEDEGGRFRFTALADVGVDVAIQEQVLVRAAATIAGVGARWGIGVSSSSSSRAAGRRDHGSRSRMLGARHSGRAVRLGASGSRKGGGRKNP